VGERDLLRRQRRKRFEQTRQRFFDGNHGSASQSPDRPPDLRSRRKSAITIPRSTALHMSYPGKAATLAAESASISTPVRPRSLQVAVISTAERSGTQTRSTPTEV